MDPLIPLPILMIAAGPYPQTMAAAESDAEWRKRITTALLSGSPYVFIDNLNRVLPKGELLPAPLIASATFGAPLRLETGEPRNDFLARARQAILDLRQN